MRTEFSLHVLDGVGPINSLCNSIARPNNGPNRALQDLQALEVIRLQELAPQDAEPDSDRSSHDALMGSQRNSIINGHPLAWTFLVNHRPIVLAEILATTPGITSDQAISAGLRRISDTPCLRGRLMELQNSDQTDARRFPPLAQ